MAAGRSAYSERPARDAELVSEVRMRNYGRKRLPLRCDSYHDEVEAAPEMKGFGDDSHEIATGRLY